jgi:hypothetical protein
MGCLWNFRLAGDRERDNIKPKLRVMSIEFFHNILCFLY